MFVRGIRGAITCQQNTAEDILSAVKELWLKLQEENGFSTEDLASVIFSSTKDLDAAFPAAALRELGIDGVPLFGTLEIDKKDAVKMCIRILIHWNTMKNQAQIKHIYLKNAAVLRPDLK